MDKKLILVALAALLMLAACAGRQAADSADAQVAMQAESDDATIYGLACDGCTDTILVLLCNVEHDPDTFNILEATRQRQVFGRPNIGDRMAVVRNAEDSTAADLVIDLEELQATWCYEALPTLRKRADMSEKEAQKMLAEMPDSVRQELMVAREYGFQIKGDNTMTPIGMSYRALTSDEESPFDYPELKRYRQWTLHNGHLVLTETHRDSLGNVVPTSSDTAQLVLLMGDTLVLRFNDGEHGYYRRTEK